MMIRLALADDEALFRKGLLALLEKYSDVEVVLEASDGLDLLQQLRQENFSPDILLLDMKMPRLSGVETSKIIRDEFPSIKVVVLSTHFSKAFIVNMIELGAAAYLPKDSSPDQVIQCLREVQKNGFSYNQEVLKVLRENMIEKTRPKISSSFDIELTNREREVLQLICEEYSATEIAEKLFISSRTVDGHRNNLLEKLGCKNVAGLVVYAIQHNLVNIQPEQFWYRKK